MNTKRLLKAASITVILFLVIAATQVVSLGIAQPYEAYTYTASPSITINSPLYNGTHATKNIQLSFVITKPEHGWLTSWTVSSDPEEIFKNELSHVNIVIDGELYRSLEADSDLSSPFSYSENLTGFEDGAHNLAIIAHCDGWELEAHGFWEHYLPYNVTSDLLIFTIDTTSPTSTPEPTSTPINEPQTVDQQVIAVVAITAIVTGTVLGLLLHFKKRKH